MGVFLSLVVVTFAGCNSQEGALAKQIRTLTRENEALRRDFNEEQQRAAGLERRVEALRAFGHERAEYLVTVAEAKLGRFTGAFDADEDGIDEGVKVYLELRDRQGDMIKAGGQVDIELWDLAGETGGPVAQRHYAPGETQEHWLGGLMANHYKFEVEWSDGNRPAGENVTVRLRFTEALTGKVFEVQEMIRCRAGRIAKTQAQ